MSSAHGPSNPMPLRPPTATNELDRRYEETLQQRKRRQFLQTALAGGVVFAAVGVTISTWLLLTQEIDPAPGGLTCEQVHAQARRMVDEKLSDDTDRQMREHIANCDKCYPLLKHLLGP